MHSFNLNGLETCQNGNLYSMDVTASQTYAQAFHSVLRFDGVITNIFFELCPCTALVCCAPIRNCVETKVDRVERPHRMRVPSIFKQSRNCCRKCWTSFLWYFFWIFSYRFQRACTKYGVPDVDLFQTTDLWDYKNIVLVTQTIFAIGRAVS